MQSLRKLALSLPGVEEGIACKGTALECSAFKARNKAFFFLGAAELKVKLQESLAEATRLGAKAPDRYQVGVHGWVSVKVSSGAGAPLELLKRWIAESYRLLAPPAKARAAATKAAGTKKQATTAKKGAARK